MHIVSLEAHEIKDTRGRPTVEVELVAIDGDGSQELRAMASVPSGKSTGSHEAKELRDEDGNGVSRVLELLNGEIAQMICSQEFFSLRELDNALIVLDDTPDKSRLGSNGILAVSIASARLFASARGTSLWKYVAEETDSTPRAPRLFANVINGGAHADFRLPFQEYMVVCGGGEQTVEQSFAALTSIYEELRGVLVAEFGENNVPMGDEGGYSPTFSTIEKPFEILSKLIDGKPHLSLAIDAAASELRSAPSPLEGEGWGEGYYTLIDKKYSRNELLELYERLVNDFHLHSIEDPFAEDDLEGFRDITEKLGMKTMIVGDDLTVTNPVRIAQSADDKLANAIIIKPNQIGTVSEVFDAVRTAREHEWKIIVSHRSGETNDTFISDLAYGLGAYGIKAGGLAQPERLAKYHRLLEI